MSPLAIVALLIVYALGAAASAAWAQSLETTALLGFLLWTSFFGFCNAVGWATWWSREHWLD
jgi:hypothetical protein